MAISAKLARFVGFFRGDANRDAVVAARLCGFDNPIEASVDAMLNKSVIAEISRLDQIEGYVPRLSAEEVEQGITEIAMDTANKTQDRLAAFKLVAQIKGMLIDKQIIEDGRVNKDELIEKVRTIAVRRGWLKPD